MEKSKLERQLIIFEILSKYDELDKKKRFMMKNNGDSNNYDYVYKYIREELLKIHNDPYYITDVLVTYLYKYKNSSYKSTLWNSFGDILVENLKHNLGNSIVCEDCDERFEPTKQRQNKCLDCQERTKKEKAKLRKKKFNSKNKKK